MFGAIHWREIFIPDTPILEIIVRGTLLYLSVFVLLRVVAKRQPGGTGLSDLLVIVLIADASQNAMTGDYHSLTDGVLLVGVLVLWDFLIDTLESRVPFLARLLMPPPVPLVRNGQMLRRNMRHERITEEELATKIREKGLEDMKDVRLAQMEGDGQLSVLGYENKVQDDDEPEARRF